MDLGLAGKVAVVTGGASGIGQETACTLAREGAAVVVADRDPDNLARAVDALRAAGGRAEAFELDVRDYGACAALMRAAVDACGGLDVLVNAAGITRESFFLESRPEDWSDVVAVNLVGVMNCCHAAAPILCERRGGAIVNVGSEAGKVGEKRMVVYSATKGAVLAFTKALAAELGRDGVRANAVCPGVTRTPMTSAYTEEQWQKMARRYPLGRLGEPEDIASVIAFLASDRSSWMTGQAVSVSGGFSRA